MSGIPGGGGNSNPNWPTLNVSLGFGQSPNQISPSYPLNIAAKTRTLTLTRGRQYELAAPQAGELDGAPDNTDGQFSPESGLVLNLLDPELAAPGCVTGTIANIVAAIGGGVTATIDTAQKLPAGPVQSLKLIIPTSFLGGFACFESVRLAAPTTATCSFAAQVNAIGSAVGADLMIVWWNAAGAQITSSFGTTVAAGTIGYSTITNVTVPTGATTYSLACTPAPTTTSPQTIWIGNFCAVTGATVAQETVLPNYPNVKVETPITVTATWAGQPYSLWTGFVERWPQTWTDPVFGVVNLEAIDALSALANINLDAAYDAEVLLDDPVAYYPMHEDSGSLSIANASATLQPNGVVVLSKVLGSTAPTFGSTSLLAPLGDGGTSVTGSSTSAGFNEDGGCLQVGYMGSGPFPNPVGGFAFEDWFESKVAADIFVLVSCGLLFNNFTITYKAGLSGTASVTLADITQQITVTGNISLNTRHHIVVNLAADQETMTVYIDGVLFGTAALTIPMTAANVPTTCMTIGGAITTGPTSGAPTSMGDVLSVNQQISNWASYPAPLSLTRIQSHYRVGLNAADGETTAARHARILSYAGWAGPNSAYQTASFAGPLISAGIDAATALQVNADSECGALYIAGNGSVDLAGRQYRETLLPAGNGNPNQGTAWVCGDGPGEYHYDSAPVFDYDPTYVYNDIAVERTGGLTATVVDPTSLVDYFPRSLPKTVCLHTDSDATDQAGWLVSRYKQPAQRAEVVTFSPSSDPNLWPFVLGVEQGDLITINRRPNNAPMTTIVGFVEQIAHTIAPSPTSIPWQVAITVSPLFTYYGRTAALRTTLAALVNTGATTMTLNPLVDAALNPAETAILPSAPAGTAQSGATVTAATLGTRLTIDPAGANPETVTVTAIASAPTARTAGYTSIAVTFTPALAHAHAANAVVCEALPAGHTNPADWDPYAMVDDGSGLIGDLVVSY